MIDTNDKINEIKDENVIRDEYYPENPDEVAKEKQANNEQKINGNIGKFQAFIQNLNLRSENDYRKFKRIFSEDSNFERCYDLRKIDECAKFVEHYKGGEYVALAIVLCVFEVVSLGDLANLKSKLIEQLPYPVEIDDDGRTVNKQQQDPYLSLNSMLAAIGAKTYINDAGQRCTGFGEDSEKALINIWEQFPDLRSHIISWLVDVSETFEFHTTLDSYQIVTAFRRLILVDFSDAKKRIFPQLYISSENFGLLGALAYELYIKSDYQQEILEMINEWIQLDSHWLWKSASFAYLNFDGKYDHRDFNNKLKHAIGKRFDNLGRSDIIFIALFMSCSEKARTLISDILNNLICNESRKVDKNKIASIYVNLVRYSYYLVGPNLKELSLVACDTIEQQKNLELVLSQVMSVYNLRRRLYAILGAYLKELSNYDITQKMESHISAYFYNLSSSSCAFRKDIVHFLENCEGNVSKQIIKKLLEFI